MKLHREPSKKSILRSAMTTFTMDRIVDTESTNYVVSNFYISRKILFQPVPLTIGIAIIFFFPSSSFPYFSLSFFFSNRELLKYESRKKSRSSDVEKEGKICIPCVSGGKTFFTGQVGSVVDSLKRWKTVAWLFTGLDGTATNYEPTRKRITGKGCVGRQNLKRPRSSGPDNSN